MSWTIKGEAGKTLNATARSLAELNISACILTFQSLAGDSLTWTAETTDATGAGTILPDAGQVVEIWKDSVRKFRGHVTGIRAGTRQITITAEGPWWWMERTNLTSDQTDGSGTTAERPVYVFPSPDPDTGHPDLKDHLEALIDRAIANGVPMARGTVAASYGIPQATLAEQPCSEALATLLAWAPDSVAWFDYSDATPVIHIGRRGTLAATTYTIGTDPVEAGELVPRLDLEVTRNELHYVTRNGTTGKPEWALQASGTSTPGTDSAGKRQIVAVSGPEIVDFLPRDDFETTEVWSHPGGNAFIWENDPGLGQAVGIPTYGFGAVADRLYAPGLEFPFNASTIYFNSYVVRREDGSALPAGTLHILQQTDVPDWALDVIGGFRATLSGTWLITHDTGYANNVPWPQWFEKLRTGATTGAFYATKELGSYRHYTHYLARQFSVSCILTTAVRYYADRAIYKPWEYSYLTPPDNLAANLVAAQNWVPWEGPLTLVGDDCSGDNLLGAKYNLAGGLAPCAAMAALARGVTHDLPRGRTTIDLGAPARLDFGTLISRIRREPKDNIVYLP